MDFSGNTNYFPRVLMNSGLKIIQQILIFDNFLMGFLSRVRSRIQVMSLLTIGTPILNVLMHLRGHHNR